MDDLKSPSPVVHHIPIVLEDDFYIEKRKSEHYSDKLRSLKVRRDQAGQNAERVSHISSNIYGDESKDSRRPTINPDTFTKPQKTKSIYSKVTGSKFYIQREKVPESTCPLHGWKRDFQNADFVRPKEILVSDRKSSTDHKKIVNPAHCPLSDFNKESVATGSLRVKKHSLDSKLAQMEEKPIQRRWSLRIPESSSSRIISEDSFKSPTLSSISGSTSGFLAEIPDYFKERKNVRSDEKSESIHDHFSALNRESRVKRSTTSTSLNSFHPTKVLFELLSASLLPPFLPASIQRSGCISKLIFTCVQNFLSQASPSNSGILKSPGKRRVSSSNRVDFLDNLQEKEIPCRQT